MLRCRALVGLLGAVFILGTSASAFAQTTTGNINGTVTDASGAVLPGVAVTANCAATGLTRTVATDAQGAYSLPNLPICVYKLTSELQGFKSVTRDVQVAVNTVAKADFKLEIGSQSETITVEGVTPLIEFSDKLNNNVDTERITEIPLSGRDFNSLLAVTPGVTREPGGGFIAVSIAGMRHTSNNYMIDGISNNDRYYGDSVMNQVGILGVPATLVPMDAIAEFTIQQTPSAEFGVKGGAAINVVMKAGTNQPHGTGYYFRHDKLDRLAQLLRRAQRRQHDRRQEPAVRRHVRWPDRQGQDLLLRVLRGAAGELRRSLRRVRSAAVRNRRRACPASRRPA